MESKGKTTILIVEDDPGNRMLIADLLASTGYRPIEAEDGEEAIALTRQERPDLILMDLSLPRLDGWEATRRLKADADLKGIPVIALTAHAMAGDETKALDAGCDGYISKPINIGSLVEEIEGYLKS
jgi:two-component system cell cycle response regulator DivK